MDVAEARKLFERELPAIRAVVGSLCRRYGLDGVEAEDFESWVTERILEDDLAILRKFEGRSRVTTYLTTVVSHLYRDYRIHTLGRWRPSAAARRLGRSAVLLDAYLNRSGHSTEEAVARLLDRDDVVEDEATLRRWAARIPRRPTAAFEDPGAAADLPPADDPADRLLLEREDRTVVAAAERALRRAVERLPERERLLLQLHYWDGLTLAAVARRLDVRQKPLYRRRDAALRRLREELERAGVDWSDVREALPG